MGRAGPTAPCERSTKQETKPVRGPTQASSHHHQHHPPGLQRSARERVEHPLHKGQVAHQHVCIHHNVNTHVVCRQQREQAGGYRGSQNQGLPMWAGGKGWAARCGGFAPRRGQASGQKSKGHPPAASATPTACGISYSMGSASASVSSGKSSNKACCSGACTDQGSAGARWARRRWIAQAGAARHRTAVAQRACPCWRQV